MAPLIARITRSITGAGQVTYTTQLTLLAPLMVDAQHSKNVIALHRTFEGMSLFSCPGTYSQMSLAKNPGLEKTSTSTITNHNIFKIQPSNTVY